MLQRPSSTIGDASDCITRARELVPMIEAHAAEIERARELVPQVLAGLLDARLFRMLLPRSCDGLEVDPITFMQVAEELAKADGSTAWCVVQGCGCTVAAAYLEPKVATEIFAPETAVMATGPFLAGNAVAVDGGYRVTGRSFFASGIKHAGWLGCHAPVLEADGTPRLNPEGKPAERTLLFPKSSARIEDVWHVIGLKGTGSDCYVVENLFVPDCYTFTRESADDRRERGPLYRRLTIYQLYGIGFAAIALGLARAALDAFVALAVGKVPYSRSVTLRENAVIQSQVAVCEAKLASARSYLIGTVREGWELPGAGEAASMPQRAAIKLAAVNASHQAKDVLETVYHAAGATAIFERNPYERRLRDIYTLLQQVQGHYANFELVGQVLLGLPSQTKLI